uniref:(3R)-3-hydroxyacyl-CoA dehydrogenase n=1 Tax=Amblyomma aureolatum TaxID=187763 RepID=A0A1E1XEP0_9ACAR
MSLEGRLALVTGGASGIGKAACHALASQGATVVVADLNLDAANSVAQSLPGSATHRGAFVDVGDSESVEELFAHVKDMGSLPVSIVVNSAGVAHLAPLVETSDEDFDRVIRINLKGTFLVTRAAARAMTASGVADAVIVNIASILAKTGLAMLSPYCASKGGVMALTKTVAQELAPHGIRCNAVLPSLTRTPMGYSLPEEIQVEFVAKTPLKRMGEPEEVAQAILFLCSPQSSYLTGAGLEVTGGYGM